MSQLPGVFLKPCLRQPRRMLSRSFSASMRFGLSNLASCATRRLMSASCISMVQLSYQPVGSDAYSNAAADDMNPRHKMERSACSAHAE